MSEPNLTSESWTQPPADAPEAPARTARFVAESTLPVSNEALWAYHSRPGAFERLAPPWQKLRVLARSGGIEAGDTLTMKVWRGPIGLTWHAEHGAAEAPRRFSDLQRRGPFAYWHHVHTFEASGRDTAVLRDAVAWRLPFGRIAHALLGWMFRRDLERMFRFRHERTALDLSRQTEGVQTMRIAITGASGLVGQALVPFLTTAGHDVRVLVRRAAREPHEIMWNPATGEADIAALEGVDAVIHLAGENVGGGRWTDERKRAIRESRDQGTRTIASAIARLQKKPRVFISASASGYYGNGPEGDGAPALDETAPAGNGFLADVCRAWEDAAEPARAAGVRVVHPRIGIVLDPRGGALQKLLTPFRMGAGGRVGSGRQWMSWIGIDDLIGMFAWLLSDETVSGPVNAVAPGAVQQAEFARVLARVLRRPAVVPLPAFAVRAMFGAMGEELLLGGVRLRPAVAERAGFRFAHADLETALRFLLGRSS
jgi:uncharacterized protein (TIGR01777 family)